MNTILQDFFACTPFMQELKKLNSSDKLIKELLSLYETFNKGGSAIEPTNFLGCLRIQAFNDPSIQQKISTGKMEGEVDLGSFMRQFYLILSKNIDQELLTVAEINRPEDTLLYGEKYWINRYPTSEEEKMVFIKTLPLLLVIIRNIAPLFNANETLNNHQWAVKERLIVSNKDGKDQARYELQSVGYRIGDKLTTGGHAIAITRYDATWYRCSDSLIEKLNDSDVKKYLQINGTQWTNSNIGVPQVLFYIRKEIYPEHWQSVFQKIYSNIQGLYIQTRLLPKYS